MTIVLNGEQREVPSVCAVVDVVALVAAGDATGVAVARNGEIVRRAVWQEVRLCAGDELEVLQAVAGG